MPLLSWDIFLESYQQLMTSSKQVRKDLAALEKLAALHKWNRSFNYQPYLISPLNAIVVTDANRHIVWVSHNFHHLTGYSSREVLGKTPALLQGRETSAQVKQTIHKQLQQAVEIKNAQLVNYKKNGSSYVCEFDIFPVYNTSQQLVHFIAFERELVV